MKCFLSFSTGLVATRVQEKLRELKVTILDAYDLSPGKTISESLKSKLIQSDFAIFILSDFSENTLYEIGICDGLGKPYLLVLEKRIQLPIFLANAVYIRTQQGGHDFLGITLESFVKEHYQTNNDDQILSMRARPQISHEYAADSVISGPSKKFLLLGELVEKIPELREKGDGQEIERAAESVFRTLGLKYVTNTTARDKGADFALWNDKLGRVFGNPIIVEVKSGLLSRPRINEAEKQLRAYADKASAKIAILLYLDKNGRRYEVVPSLNPLIVAFDIEDLVQDLLKSSFEKLILRHRNKIAHGRE